MRLPDTPHGELPDGFRVGDYWKILERGTGEPRRVTWPDKLTDECWHVVVPMGDAEGFGIANLERHTVREHEDGTISVRPNDGSTNSILLIGAKGARWHGYIEHGELRAV